MTAALRADLNQFLFSPIADDAEGMPLTLLSALARLDVDPWDEAASLAELPRESATQKLIALLARMPNGPTPGVDTETLASRLVALLHPATRPRPAAPGESTFISTPPPSKGVKVAIYYLLAMLFLVVGQWALTNRHIEKPADTSLPASP